MSDKLSEQRCIYVSKKILWLSFYRCIDFIEFKNSANAIQIKLLQPTFYPQLGLSITMFSPSGHQIEFRAVLQRGAAGVFLYN